MLRISWPRYAGRCYTVGKTAFSFNDEGICEFKDQGYGAYDLECLLRLNGVSLVKKPDSDVVYIDQNTLEAIQISEAEYEAEREASYQREREEEALIARLERDMELDRNDDEGDPSAGEAKEHERPEQEAALEGEPQKFAINDDGLGQEGQESETCEERGSGSSETQKEEEIE